MLRLAIIGTVLWVLAAVVAVVLVLASIGDRSCDYTPDRPCPVPWSVTR